MPISEQNCKGSGVWRGCREHGHSSKVVAVTKETRFKKKISGSKCHPLRDSYGKEGVEEEPGAVILVRCPITPVPSLSIAQAGPLSSGSQAYDATNGQSKNGMADLP